MTQQGQIKTSTPKTIVFNREWTPSDGKFTNYYYDIEFDDGQVGQFSTNKPDGQQTKFKVGEETKYILKKVSKKGTQMLDKFTEDKPQGRYGDPTVNERTAYSVCWSAAIKSMNMFKKKKIADGEKMKGLTEEDIDQVTIFYWNWVKKEGMDKRDESSIRWNAIMNAVEAIELIEIDNFKGVVETAQASIDYLNHATKK